MAGRVGIADHVTIGDHVTLAAGAVVHGNISEPGVYSGTPARPHQGQMRVMAATQRIPDLLKVVRSLEKRVAELEKGQ